jgi:hypothetical protein
VSQEKYIKDMLRKFGLDEAKSIHTTIGTNGHLALDTSDYMVDKNVYRSMIGAYSI